MLYIVYLAGSAACLMGIIRAIVVVRGFLWTAREGRVAEGMELFELGLVNASGIFLFGVQILLIAQHRGLISNEGHVPLSPGLAGVILLTISSVWAHILRRKESARKSMRQ